ncbi:phosphoribosyltransferase-like protein [Parachaetomium inaequale]|uniref:Phosphoribosyltransferase-like protein n=1 Tax=Parachaetomium inaequale TaxID=2588326 RepID=A0AAN6SUW3_9PEZI|nr:phosphoribosyltransferase-like protein [Parachaetomium inaequale]
MVRNIVLLSGSSHPAFVESVAATLGVAPSSRVLAKFASGETRCEIRDSVRGKDVYIVQSFGVGGGGDEGGGEGEGEAEKREENYEVKNAAADSQEKHTVNDYFVELCIMISACKTGSARRVTAVLPLFPYSRQPDLPFSKVGAPLVGMSSSPQREGKGAADGSSGRTGSDHYTFESVPATPGPNIPRTAGLGSAGVDVVDMIGAQMSQASKKGNGWVSPALGSQQQPASYTTHDYENPSLVMALQARSGHKQFMAQAGSLVADLLTCAGADRILTCDLHESAYQGFFDIPVDNLYARPLLKRYIQQNIPNYRDAVIVSPDAGGAKRATAIADSLGLAFALIHKERRPPKISQTPKATMMLVGDVAARVCILIDDLADTANTITRAAKLLKREGAGRVVALLTHGVLSGDAVARINASALDAVAVTNTVAQEAHQALCPKLEVLDVSGTFAEAIRRVHHGESVSTLFQYD